MRPGRFQRLEHCQARMLHKCNGFQGRRTRQLDKGSNQNLKQLECTHQGIQWLRYKLKIKGCIISLYN